MQKIPAWAREKVRRLVADGVSVRAAARAAGVSPTTATRVMAEPGAALAVRSEEPFGATPSPGVPVPLPAHNADQPPPPPDPPRYDPRYHGHTFRVAAPAPAALGAWSIERIRNSIDLHDMGYFLESWMLSVVVSRFGPVHAAMGQAVAPALALPRHVRGGQRGLARILRDEVEAQLAPRAGLLPSPCFPPTIWGSVDIEVTGMGFGVLQHAYGDEDPLTGVRPIYTRRWPTWSTQYLPSRRTYQALTLDGPVDIISGDGKFTLIGDTETPHYHGAIRALALEVLDGTLVKQARASYVDRYGNPKWVGIMPEKVGVRSPEGDAYFDALYTIQGPNGFGALPHGSDLKIVEMGGAQSTVFKDSLDNIWQYVAAILLGTDGTMSPSTGVYSAPIFAGVRRDIIDRKLKALVRGVNMGHVAPWLAFNYAASIATAGGWIAPVLDIPLPDPSADARQKSIAERISMLHKIVKEEREAKFLVTQDRVNALAEQLGVDAPVLAPETAVKGWNVQLAPTTQEKILRVDEGRAALGGDPIGDERGDLLIVELEAQAAATPPPTESTDVSTTDEPLNEATDGAATPGD